MPGDRLFISAEAGERPGARRALVIVSKVVKVFETRDSADRVVRDRRLPRRKSEGAHHWGGASGSLRPSVAR
jgi:hypothetical protein